MPSQANSNRLATAGQSATVRLQVWVIVVRLLLTSICIGQTGCNSIYHRAWATLPAEPESQLKMRMEEAQAAECLATQAGTKLLADLKSGMGSELIQADFDRLEMSALELQRRVLTIRDIPGPSGVDVPLAVEINRLQLRSESWLALVQTSRREDSATQLRRLEAMSADVQPVTTK